MKVSLTLKITDSDVENKFAVTVDRWDVEFGWDIGYSICRALMATGVPRPFHTLSCAIASFGGDEVRDCSSQEHELIVAAVKVNEYYKELDGDSRVPSH